MIIVRIGLSMEWNSQGRSTGVSTLVTASHPGSAGSTKKVTVHMTTFKEQFDGPTEYS